MLAKVHFRKKKKKNAEFFNSRLPININLLMTQTTFHIPNIKSSITQSMQYHSYSSANKKRIQMQETMHERKIKVALFQIRKLRNYTNAKKKRNA